MDGDHYSTSYLIYSDFGDDTHKEFRLQCAWGLILVFETPRESEPRGHRAADRLQRSTSILPYLPEDILRLVICLHRYVCTSII